MQPTYIKPGQTGTIAVAYSECAMCMRVAGRVMRFKVTGEGDQTWWPMVQLLDPDGRPFSSPITCGEAGVYTTADGRMYYYPPDDHGEG
jgi:hypothetical protein